MTRPPSRYAIRIDEGFPRQSFHVKIAVADENHPRRPRPEHVIMVGLPCGVSPLLQESWDRIVPDMVGMFVNYEDVLRGYHYQTSSRFGPRTAASPEDSNGVVLNDSTNVQRNR